MKGHAVGIKCEDAVPWAVATYCGIPVLWYTGAREESQCSELSGDDVLVV